MVSLLHRATITIAILFIFSTAKDIETLPQNIAIATSIGFIGIANNPACCMVPQLSPAQFRA